MLEASGNEGLGGAASEIQQHARPERVGEGRSFRVSLVGHGAGRAGEVVHEVDRFRNFEMVDEVVVHECERRVADVLDVLEIAGVQVVDAHDLVAVCKQEVAEPRKPAPPRVEPTSSSPRRRFAPVAPRTST